MIILGHTADTSPKLLEECKRAGMDGMVPKPCKKKNLVGTLVRFMEQRKAAAHVQAGAGAIM